MDAGESVGRSIGRRPVAKSREEPVRRDPAALTRNMGNQRVTNTPCETRRSNGRSGQRARMLSRSWLGSFYDDVEHSDRARRAQRALKSVRAVGLLTLA